MSNIIPGTQSLSGLTTVVADKCLVSPPEITKRPKDIFEQFLRVPQGISVYDGTWSAIDDEHCPGTESILRFLKRRPRSVMLDNSSTFFITKKIMNVTESRRKPFLLIYETTLFYKGKRGRDGRDGRGIQEANVTEEYKLYIKYTDNTEWTSEQSIRGPQGEEGPPSEVPGPAGAPGITTYAVVPVGIGFDTSTQPPRGQRGARGRDGEAGKDGRAYVSADSSSLFSSTGLRGRPGHDGKDGRIFLIPEEPLFLPRGKTGKTYRPPVFFPEPVFARNGKDGQRGPRGKPLFLQEIQQNFVQQKQLQIQQNLFQKQENFFIVRPKKVVPQPLLVSTHISHNHRRTFIERNYQTSVSTNLHQWLLKTVQKKTFQHILATTQQNFVTQKHQHIQKFLLTKNTTEAFKINRYYSEKKTQLVQTFSSNTSLRQTSVNKTIHLYQAPVSYHFVQNVSRIERLVQSARNSNGLVFSGESSLTLTGDAAVSMS